jgi:hypothetical protein
MRELHHPALASSTSMSSPVSPCISTTLKSMLCVPRDRAVLYKDPTRRECCVLIWENYIRTRVSHWCDAGCTCAVSWDSCASWCIHYT